MRSASSRDYLIRPHLRAWNNQIGTIEPGKIANLIVTNGDPLELTTDLRYFSYEASLRPRTTGTSRSMKVSSTAQSQRIDPWRRLRCRMELWTRSWWIHVALALRMKGSDLRQNTDSRSIMRTSARDCVPTLSLMRTPFRLIPHSADPDRHGFPAPAQEQERLSSVRQSCRRFEGSEHDQTFTLKERSRVATVKPRLTPRYQAAKSLLHELLMNEKSRIEAYNGSPHGIRPRAENPGTLGRPGRNATGSRPHIKTSLGQSQEEPKWR